MKKHELVDANDKNKRAGSENEGQESDEKSSALNRGVGTTTMPTCEINESGRRYMNRRYDGHRNDPTGSAVVPLVKIVDAADNTDDEKEDRKWRKNKSEIETLGLGHTEYRRESHGLCFHERRSESLNILLCRKRAGVVGV